MNSATYYTYKKGNVRFYALDSDYMDPKQLSWLETQLRNDAGSGDWKIRYFHHPLYSSGKTHGPATYLRLLLEPLFVKYGVNAVFAGHEHVYERVQPQKGIYYFTEGASGQLRYGNLRKSEITIKGFDTDRTFMLVEIAGDEMYPSAATSQSPGPSTDGILRRNDFAGYGISPQASCQHGGLIPPAHEKLNSSISRSSSAATISRSNHKTGVEKSI